MIGGYQILDLRGLDLEITQSEQSLTNKNVLDQLLLFRDHIDKAYDFNKPLENQLKPVLIRFRDKKNGEKIEGATFGELSVKGNYYTFQITGRISGAYTLQIVVEFEEITNDYGNQEWVIKTATIQLIDASNVLEDNIAIDGDLSVNGLIEGNEIIERMTGYSANIPESDGLTKDITYVGIVKTGNKLTLAIAGKLTPTNNFHQAKLIEWSIPINIGAKIYNATLGVAPNEDYFVDNKDVSFASSYSNVVKSNVFTQKLSDNMLVTYLQNGVDSTYDLEQNTEYFFRYELTLLLSENLVS